MALHIEGHRAPYTVPRTTYLNYVRATEML